MKTEDTVVASSVGPISIQNKFPSSSLSGSESGPQGSHTSPGCSLSVSASSRCKQEAGWSDKVPTEKSGKLNGIGPGKVMPSCYMNKFCHQICACFSDIKIRIKIMVIEKPSWNNHGQVYLLLHTMSMRLVFWNPGL